MEVKIRGIFESLIEVKLRKYYGGSLNSLLKARFEEKLWGNPGIY